MSALGGFHLTSSCLSSSTRRITSSRTIWGRERVCRPVADAGGARANPHGTLLAVRVASHSRRKSLCYSCTLLEKAFVFGAWLPAAGRNLVRCFTDAPTLRSLTQISLKRTQNEIRLYNFAYPFQLLFLAPVYPFHASICSECPRMQNHPW